jgi:hypothetical protein
VKTFIVHLTRSYICYESAKLTVQAEDANAAEKAALDSVDENTHWRQDDSRVDQEVKVEEVEDNG